tara:strand:+ start:266 stop:766 length:501 start_codon:yes stop_codon:yes gene_type:complete
MLPSSYRSISDVGSAYQRGDISYYEAYEILVNQFGYSNNDATEYLDELVVDSDRPPTIPEPVEPPPLDGVEYPHMMYDCETGKGYMAQNFQMHHGMLAMGYVHDLSECKIPPPPNGGGNNDFLEKAGSQVIGIATGTLRAVIPITAMAVAVGFMRRIVKFGTGVSS